MTCRALLRCCALLPLLGACGPAVEASPEGSTSGGPSPTSTGTVDEAGSSSTGSTGGGTSSSTTTEPSAESSTTDTVLDTSSSTGALDYCDDLPGRDSMQLVPEEPSPRGTTVVDALCVVEGSMATETLRTFQLQCDEGLEQPVLHELDVYAHDGQNGALLEGETVRFRTFRNYPIDYGFVSVVLVTTPEGELLAGDYTWPEPFVPKEVAAWFDVTVDPLDIGCATVEPPPPVNSFIMDPCPHASTVMGADVVWNGYAVTLEPGTRTPVGDLLFSGSFRDYDYVRDVCFAEGIRGGVAVLRQRG